MNYWNEGLVTSSDPVTENRNLFYAEYLALGGVDQGFNSFMHQKQLPNGLYLRSSLHTNRTVSHDEITGWMASSYILKTGHKLEIWKTLLSNYGAYPAVVKDFTDKLPYNPGNYYSWASYAGSASKYLFLPMYFINLLIAIAKEKQNTSSKIIYWLELSTMPKTWINLQMKKIFEAKMKSQYGEKWLESLFSIYFANESRTDFPIWKEILK